MPPRAKVTKGMIVEAGFEVARAEGAEALNARRVAAALGCSTQPVMSHFATMDALRQAVYARADDYHSEYLTRPEPCDNPLTAIGLRYVRFGAEEPKLFRLLFQSNQFARMDVATRVDSSGETLAPVYAALQTEAGCDMAACRDIFAQLFITAHGLASLLANNAMAFDPEFCARLLERAFEGAMAEVQKEQSVYLPKQSERSHP